MERLYAAVLTCGLVAGLACGGATTRPERSAAEGERSADVKVVESMCRHYLGWLSQRASRGYAKRSIAAAAQLREDGRRLDDVGRQRIAADVKRVADVIEEIGRKYRGKVPSDGVAFVALDRELDLLPGTVCKGSPHSRED